jgi:N-methylhydantoinase A
VTDANVVLGLIRPDAQFGGGAIRLKPKLAHRALARIAGSLGDSVTEAARGVVEVANSNMLRAIRLVTVQRGVDPRDLTLVAYGGAGPLHAAQLAVALKIPRVLVPALSSTFSALGCLTSELRYDVVQTFRRSMQAVAVDEIENQLRRLECAAAEPLRREGHQPAAIAIRRSIDLRYAGQNYEIEVPLPLAPLDRTKIRELFCRQHEALYGYATEEPIECVTLRVAALVPSEMLCLPERRPRGRARLVERHPCVVPGAGAVHVTVYSRADLGVDEPIAGPALVEDEQSTTVVLPGQRARTDAVGNLYVESI